MLITWVMSYELSYELSRASFALASSNFSCTSFVHGWPVPKHRLARRTVSSRISTPEASALRERSLPYQLRSTRKLLTRRKVADRSTLKAQDLTRLNRDVFGEIRAFHPLLTPKLMVVLACFITIPCMASNTSRRGAGQWGGTGGAICEDHFWSVCERCVDRVRC